MRLYRWGWHWYIYKRNKELEGWKMEITEIGAASVVVMVQTHKCKEKGDNKGGCSSSCN